MAYVHYITEIKPGLLERFCQLLPATDEFEGKLLARYGAKLVGHWRTVVGASDVVISLYYWEDFSRRSEVVKERARLKDTPAHVRAFKEVNECIARTTTSLVEPIGAPPLVMV